jgi:hypothetical protein
MVSLKKVKNLTGLGMRKAAGGSSVDPTYL